MELSFTDKKSIVLAEKLSNPISFLDSKKQHYITKQVNKILGEEFDFKSLFLYIEKIKRKYFLDKLVINTEEDIKKLNKNFKLIVEDIISYLNLNLKFDGLYSIQNSPGYTGITNIINNGLNTRELNKEKRALLNKEFYFINSEKISIPIYKTSLHKIIEGWTVFDIYKEDINYSKLFSILNIVFSNLSSEISSIFYANNSILLKNAIIDPLTNAYKKEYFKDMLKSDLLALGKNEELLIMFLDIDFFKKVNDTYGHDVGDFVLREFGNEIKRSIRDVDYVGRFGGEEFIVAMKLDNLKFNDACKYTSCYKHIVKRFNNTLKNNILNNPILSKYKLKFSGGVSYSGKLDNKNIDNKNIDNKNIDNKNIDNKNISLFIDKFIGKADTNLYEAKENGRNKIYFSDGTFIE